METPNIFFCKRMYHPTGERPYDTLEALQPTMGYGRQAHSKIGFPCIPTLKIRLLVLWSQVLSCVCVCE